jgi:hypothetical protein
MTTAYVWGLVSAYPDIREIWLIGSQADGSARSDSGWDFLAFADVSALSSLAASSAFNRSEVDLLIVYDGDNFCKPCPDGDREKKGSLTAWNWHQAVGHRGTLQSNEATRW